ncbi:amidohydrolase family protein [Hamadaea sp. NPDC051192]|uniref:amidohydrolase family protein n=1 Tax=Hamadaea sp. NPDC051192 TaxID=3154940 RepID=UPI0034338C65
MTSLTSAVFARRAQRQFTIVDAHAHAGPYSLFFIPDSGPDAMVRVMDRCGVSRALFSSHLAIQLDASAGNDVTAAAVSAHPGRLSGYLVINPWQDPRAEAERYADDPRFAGIKLHPSLHHYALTGPRYAAAFEYAELTGCPVLTHTYAGSEWDDLSVVAAVAERYPSVTILAGHSGITPTGFDSAIAVARRMPNVVLEVCGSFMRGEDIIRMVGELGADRVVFGSDFPFIDLRMSLGRVIFAQLSDEERAAVLGGTMLSLLSRQRSAHGTLRGVA